MDKKVISCAFNIDTACVEVKFADGSVIAIDCTLVEAEVARNIYESSELEWLVYNAPVDYVNLLLHGDVREYLRNVTEYHPFENRPLPLYTIIHSIKRDTEGMVGRIWGFTHLECRFWASESNCIPKSKICP